MNKKKERKREWIYKSYSPFCM